MIYSSTHLKPGVALLSIIAFTLGWHQRTFLRHSKDSYHLLWQCLLQSVSINSFGASAWSFSLGLNTKQFPDWSIFFFTFSSCLNVFALFSAFGTTVAIQFNSVQFNNGPCHKAASHKSLSGMQWWKSEAKMPLCLLHMLQFYTCKQIRSIWRLHSGHILASELYDGSQWCYAVIGHNWWLCLKGILTWYLIVTAKWSRKKSR